MRSCKGLSLLLFVTSLWLLQPPYARSDSLSPPELSDYILYGWSAAFLATYTHELGHYYVAKSMGADDVHLKVSLTGLWGETHYSLPPSTSVYDQRKITLAGYASNRLMAGSTGLLLDTFEPGGRLGRWGAGFYIANRLWLVSEWTMSWFSPSNDFRRDSRLHSSKKRLQNQLLLGWGLLLGLDIALSWDSIERNVLRWQTGRADKQAEAVSHVQVQLLQEGPALSYHQLF